MGPRKKQSPDFKIDLSLHRSHSELPVEEASACFQDKFFTSHCADKVFSGAYQQNFAGAGLLLVHLKIKMHQQTLTLL